MAFDQTIADQLTTQMLSAAITQQQLNAAQARNMVASAGSVLTLSVQLTHLAGVQHILGSSPLAAAAAAQLHSASLPQQVAGSQTTSRAPSG